MCADAKRTVRVRISDDKGYITVKGRSNDGGLSRFEWEKEISVHEAEALLSLCEPGVIDKVRYIVNVGTHVFEVDEFHGDNEGLLLAEVELSSVDEDFERPQWLGEEVTGDRRYYNSYLSVHPFITWSSVVPE
jgi:CYTH domain-containing protein